MAKPADITPAQETVIRQKLKLQPDADISWVYDTMSEDGVRRLATPIAAPVTTPKPTPKPSTPKPVAPKPTTPPRPKIEAEPKVTPTAAPTIAPVTINFVRDWETDRKSTRLNSSHRL